MSLSSLVRRLSSLVLGSGALLALAWGCASSSADSSPGSPFGSGGATDASNQGDSFVKLDGDMMDGSGSQLNPLCGVELDAAASCLPDDRNACLGFQPPSIGQAGEGGQAGASSSPPPGGAGGGGGVGGESGAPAEAGAPDQDGGMPPDGGADNPPFGCQVTTQNGSPMAACAKSGHGGVDAPCNSSGDCQAHLACVNSAALGSAGSSIPLCRPFCCQGDGQCNTGNYCAERPLRDDRVQSSGPDAGPPAQVPVCVPADDCDLAAPYPCPAGVDCVCKGATACMVVRSGTTACVVPGTGQEQEPCPCAFGYVCSADANVCLKLCLVGSGQSCGVGLCQSVAGLPLGWGVCIGDTPPG